MLAFLLQLTGQTLFSRHRSFGGLTPSGWFRIRTPIRAEIRKDPDISKEKNDGIGLKVL